MYGAGDLFKSGRANVAATASGNNEVVAAVTDKKIRVVSGILIADVYVNIKFQSATTDKTGLFRLAPNTGFIMPHNPSGWTETAAGEALNLNLSATANVGGVINYVEV